MADHRRDAFCLALPSADQSVGECAPAAAAAHAKVLADPPRMAIALR